MGMIRPGDLDRQITFQAKQRPAGRGKAGQEQWADVATVWAQVLDILPSKAEKLAEGMTMASRPARIRTWYRDDITSDMRIAYGTRVMRIIAGPAEIGDYHEGIELMAEDFSTAGTGA